MATNYTENYKLCQWDGGDKVNREEFNQDNSRIEAGLSELLSKLEEAKTSITADVGILTGKLTTMEGSLTALETDLSAVEKSMSTVETSVSTANTNISTLNTSLSDLTTTVGKCYSSSNRNVSMGVYVGTGSSLVLNFNSVPLMFWVMRENYTINPTYSAVSCYYVTNQTSSSSYLMNHSEAKVSSKTVTVSGSASTLNARYLYVAFH